MKRQLAEDGAGEPDALSGQVPLPAFTDVLGLCDVLLDSFHFGGGNTTAEAIATGIPIVTLPGKFIRGRFTYAWLLGWESKTGSRIRRDHYVDIALAPG